MHIPRGDKIVFGFIVFFVVTLFLAQGKLVYSDEEIKAIAKFRMLVKGITTHEYQTIDSYLIRWLRASKLDIHAAVKMFAEAQEWRKRVNVESPVNETILGIPNLMSAYLAEAVDKEGRTVRTSSLGSFDLRKLALSGKTEALLKLTRHINDKAIQKGAEAVLRSNGTLTDSRIVFVTDLTGFSLANHACLACLKFHTSHAREAELYYPGASALTVFVNAPRIAIPLTNILIGLASDETKKNLRIFGTDRSEWSKFLLKIIPADQLTYQFGGTKKV